MALALGTFMQVLDTTIANVSIPTISGNFGVSTDQGTWVITSFAVANGVSVPLTGWLMQRFGVVRTFVVSVALFTIASLLCGLAWSLPSLIAFRVLQGGVSGPMIPGSQALLINVFGPQQAHHGVGHLVHHDPGRAHRRALARRLYLRQLRLALDFPHQCAGGRVLRWLCWNNLKSQETPTRKMPIDRIGLVLLFVWVGALQIMLDKGKDLDWFNSPLIVVLLVVTVVAFAAWLIWELTEEHPIVDLSLFKSRSFALGTLALCLGYAVFFGNIVLMPLWLQSYLGYTATWAGLVSAPSGITAVLTSIMMGPLMRRFDPRADSRPPRSPCSRFPISCAPNSPPTRATWSSWRRSWCRAWRWACSSSPCSRCIFDGLPPQRYPRPPACRISCASRRPASPPPSPPHSGTGARRCISPSSRIW